MATIEKALGFPLLMTTTKVIGAATIRIPIGESNAFIDLPLQVVASSLKTQINVLFKGPADLSLLVSSYESSGGLSIYLLNGKGVDLVELVDWDCDIRGIIKRVGKYVVQTFYWSKNVGEWNTLRLPSNLFSES